MQLTTSRRRRAFAAVATLALLASGVAGGVTAASPAAAVAAVGRGMDSGAEPLQLTGLGAGPYEITLVTGDRVRLSRQGNGYDADVETVAPRPDGEPAPEFLTRAGPNGFYVFPLDAFAAVQAGRLDPDLFNVQYLAANGYDDANMPAVPVIAQYPKGRAAKAVRAAADALPASTPTAQLESVGAVAVAVGKVEAAAFWRSVRASSGAASLSAGLGKIWLDRKVTATLDESVPLVGAPAAWAAGYDGKGSRVAVLDTGIDATHPDLAGKVVASQSFVDTGPPIDRHGHGTHVASTIAGTGSTYRGVAPGADLIIGKVLNDRGSGTDSEIIEAMEWATTEQQADVVSMSLGGCCTDGTDPMSIAVNELTATTGTLFVIAAGNDGRPSSIGSPGTADAALTVAATDKSDRLANFSSRGPRLGDRALKPDIAAPGVNITAARAAGGTIGNPGDLYTTLSGTSMATPHVAGGAAILAQRHPDWQAPQLKAALMSAAEDLPSSVYEVGAGRLDVGRALNQQVHAETSNVDFRVLVTGPDAPPVSRTISYRNDSAEPVTLSLRPELTGPGAGAVPAGTLTVDTALTVPAGGTAETTVTLRPAGLERGSYSGAVVATHSASGARITTPVGAVLDVPKVRLTVRTVGRDGQPVDPEAGSVLLDVSGQDGVVDESAYGGPGITVYHVRSGVYSISQRVRWVDGGSRANEALLLNPEVTVTGDTEVVLDARRAREVAFRTPLPAGPLYTAPTAGYQRQTANGDRWAVRQDVGDNPRRGGWTRFWVTPTDRVTVGGFWFWQHWWLGRSQVEMTVRSPRHATLHPANAKFDIERGTLDDFPDYAPFTGRKDLRVADAGRGRPEDIAGVDVRGKLALMEAELGVRAGECGIPIERVQAVRDAGANAIVAYPPSGVGCPIPMSIGQMPFTGALKPVGIPVTSIPSNEGVALREQAAHGPVTVQVTGTPVTPYTYVLHPIEDGRVPSTLQYTLRPDQLARVDLDVHASQPGTAITESTAVVRPDQLISGGSSFGWAGGAYTAPRARTDYIGPLNRRAAFFRGMGYTCSPAPCPPGTARAMDSPVQMLDHPFRIRQQAFTTPISPGSAMLSDAFAALAEQSGATTEQCAMCREGNYLLPYFSWAEASGSTTLAGQALTGPPFTYRLSRNGTEIPAQALGPLRYFELPSEAGTYRLAADGADTDVTWTFQSSTPTSDTRRPGFDCVLEVVASVTGPCAPLPTLFVGYDLGASLAKDNTVAAGRTHPIVVRAYHQQSKSRMPSVAGVRLWTSFDDGGHWQELRLRNLGSGKNFAMLSIPPLNQTAGHVSLKVEAWDRAGNRVEQISSHAFTLATSPH
jgi:subtilisin family serine protease